MCLAPFWSKVTVTQDRQDECHRYTGCDSERRREFLFHSALDKQIMPEYYLI
jgi:hypothetical protein